MQPSSNIRYVSIIIDAPVFVLNDANISQDPASANAAEVNKAITLELAKQIHAVGGDPQDALKSGTFAPGKLNDPTAAGNTCDDANDPNGCIFTLGLLVPDATVAEIDAAVNGVGGGTGAGGQATVPA